MTKRVLITGASRGIGRSIAMVLADKGYMITPCASRESEAFKEVCEDLKNRQALCDALIFDVADAEAAKSAIETSIAKHGAYWGVISNAGITRDAAFPALSTDDWRRVVDVDLNGFFNVVQPCVMPMIGLRDGGRIISITSVSGITGNRGQVNYSAAKAGLIGAAKALAVELAKRKITVNCIAPGLIETDILEMNELALSAAMAMIPMKRMGQPKEVADLAAFLMSPEASYITRQVISINGGMV